MRTIIALPALLVACSGPATAAASDRPGSSTYFLESRDASKAVVYRFSVASDAAQANGGSGDATPNGGRRGAPPSIEPQTIRFANVDAKHVRLTVLDASNADTSETLVADRTPDGQIHAKLERGSSWGIPLALYDRVVTLADVGSSAQPEVPTETKIQPLASTDAVDGLLRVHAGEATHVVFDGSGSVMPSFDLFARGGPPGGGPGGDGPGGAGGGRGGMGGIFGGGGGMGGGGGFGGGRGGRGGGEHSSIPADATLHVDAEFDRFALARADGTETLAFGDSDRKRERTWSVVRVP